MYKSSKQLFDEFQYLQFRHLPNIRVAMNVPPRVELTLGIGLRDLLGFKDASFKEGLFLSEYPMELDAGITEIFVYTDIIESHHVGDTVVPLLRIIPVMGEKGEQIVRTYPMPLYFPVRKKFFDTIDVELKTSSAANITFTSGKTYLVLSFRRRSL